MLKRVIRGACALLAIVVIGLIGWKIWPDTVDTASPPIERLRSALELREDGRLYANGEELPFDGLLMENFSATTPKMQIEIREGKAHGTSRGWFENGQLEVTETFVAGVSHGLRTRRYINGNKRSEANIVNGVIEGIYREWDEDGNKALSMTLHNGQPDGLAEAWHPSGGIKSHTRFSEGKQVEQQFFADGDH